LCVEKRTAGSNPVLSAKNLKMKLNEKILKHEKSINESLELALSHAKKRGGTLGHKIGHSKKAFEEIVDMAKKGEL
jgi:hypothetical protein